MSRTKVLVAMLALAALVAVACSPAPAATVAPVATTAPAAQPTPAPTTAPLVKIQSAWSMMNPDPLPQWVAMDQGFFKQNGLDVSLMFIDGGTKHAQALISKDVQIGVTSGTPMVTAAAGGADVVLIAGLINRLNYDFLVRANIKTAADLKGKKVAVSGASGSSNTAARIALRDLFKLDPDKDVSFVTIGTETEREAALVSGQIDATVINPDVSIQAKKDGLVVLDSLWGKPTPYQHTGIATTKSFAKDNPQAITNYLKAIVQAIGYARNPANKATVIATMAKYLKSDDKEVLDSGYTRMVGTLLQCAPYITMDGTKTIIAEVKTAADKGMKPEDVVDNSFLKSIEDSGFIKANCQ